MATNNKNRFEGIPHLIHASKLIICIAIIIQERNGKLLKLKRTDIEKIVNQEITNPNFSIKQQIIDHTLQTLSHQIDTWAGINILRIKKAITTYKKYFTSAIRSCDPRKKKVLDYIFWLPVLKDIQQV